MQDLNLSLFNDKMKTEQYGAEREEAARYGHTSEYMDGEFEPLWLKEQEQSGHSPQGRRSRRPTKRASAAAVETPRNQFEIKAL